MHTKTNKKGKNKSLQPKQSVYYQCAHCKTLLYVKDKQIDESHHTGNQQKFGNQSELYYILQPIGTLTNVTVVGRDGQWRLACEECHNQLGCIWENWAQLYHNSIHIHVIRYQQINVQPTVKQQNKQKEGAKYISKKQQKARRLNKIIGILYQYLHITLRSLQSRVSSVDLTQLQSSTKQLQSFLKFYRKWMKRDNIMYDSIHRQSSLNSTDAFLAVAKK